MKQHNLILSKNTSHNIKHSEFKLSNYVEIVSQYIFKLFFRSNASNIKNTWKGINKIINISNKNRNTPPPLIVNNKLISEPVEVANKFNEYFSTIAENLQANIYHTGNDFHQYLNGRNEHSIFLQPITSDKNN